MVRRVLDLLEKTVKSLEPSRLGRQSSLQMMECFVKIEKLGAAGKALCARQVCETGAWFDTGERSPAHLVAYLSGTTVGKACGVLESAERLAKLPATEAAWRAGKLSEAQWRRSPRRRSWTPTPSRSF